ncbi:MAG: ABC transporter permease [Thermoprotei archaeon]|nr:MAG: ABC transporter permease [Thermoprotei archaeon]
MRYRYSSLLRHFGLELKIRVERSSLTSRFTEAMVSTLSVAISLIIAAAIFTYQQIDPIIAYKEIFLSAFGSFDGITYTIVKMIPLLLCGAGLIVAFKANVWNIGAEGQLLLGAIVATWIALFSLKTAPHYISIPTMFALGFIAGGLWALIPAILKIKFNVNEVLTTLMMNHIASKIVEYLIYGPWKGKAAWGFPQTDIFPTNTCIPCIPNTRIHYATLIIAISSALIISILLSRTKIGYEIRVFGIKPEVARYAGISSSRVIILSMLISGGLAGIAGVGEVAGLHHRLRYPWAISSGYGYTAIIVAWLSRLNSIAIVPVSFLLGGLLVGGDTIQVVFRLPVNVIHIFNGLILLCLASGEILLKYRFKIEVKRHGTLVSSSS